MSKKTVYKKTTFTPVASGTIPNTVFRWYENADGVKYVNGRDVRISLGLRTENFDWIRAVKNGQRKRGVYVLENGITQRVFTVPVILGELKRRKDTSSEAKRAYGDIKCWQDEVNAVAKAREAHPAGKGKPTTPCNNPGANSTVIKLKPVSRRERKALRKLVRVLSGEPTWWERLTAWVKGR